MYRIILVDDHAIVREGFRALIEREPDLSIIAECESLFDMEAALATLEPDLLVLDLSLADGGGLARMPALRRTCPGLRILVLSMHDGEPYISEALARGADGYVSKGSAADELVNAIRTTLAGDVYISSDLEQALPNARGDLLARLSARERDVFMLLVRGRAPKQIAAELGIGVKTAYVHRSSVMEKLGVRNEVELYRTAVESGILPDDHDA